MSSWLRYQETGAIPAPDFESRAYLYGWSVCTGPLVVHTFDCLRKIGQDVNKRAPAVSTPIMTGVMSGRYEHNIYLLASGIRPVAALSHASLLSYI